MYAKKGWGWVESPDTQPHTHIQLDHAKGMKIQNIHEKQVIHQCL